MLVPRSVSERQPIVQIGYMWEGTGEKRMFHAHLFCRGEDTVLGQTSDPRELFVLDICKDYPLGSIVGKAQVSNNVLYPQMSAHFHELCDLQFSYASVLIDKILLMFYKSIEVSTTKIAFMYARVSEGDLSLVFFVFFS